MITTHTTMNKLAKGREVRTMNTKEALRTMVALAGIAYARSRSSQAVAPDNGVTGPSMTFSGVYGCSYW
jgi:hypothetical protein